MKFLPPFSAFFIAQYASVVKATTYSSSFSTLNGRVVTHLKNATVKQKFRQFLFTKWRLKVFILPCEFVEFWALLEVWASLVDFTKFSGVELALVAIFTAKKYTIHSSHTLLSKLHCKRGTEHFSTGLTSATTDPLSWNNRVTRLGMILATFEKWWI